MLATGLIHQVSSSGTTVTVVQAAKDGFSHNFQEWRRCWLGFCDGKLLCNALMGSRMIEVGYILFNAPVQLRLIHNEEMIQTFPAERPNEAFTNGITIRGMVGKTQFFNPTAVREAGKPTTIFGIVIPDQVFRCVAIRGCGECRTTPIPDSHAVQEGNLRFGCTPYCQF